MIPRSLLLLRGVRSQPSTRLSPTFPSFTPMSKRHYGQSRPVPATFYRGGTSKALLFNDADLPPSREERDALFLSAMGSPDPNGRQLDGMGGGYSSVSKVVVVGKSEQEGADVDYTFCQAVGPFALETGLVPPHPTERGNLVRIFNTNTSKLVHALFPADGTRPLLSGGYTIDGVSGSHARISLEFLNPHGSRTGRFLPTGHVVDTLDLGEWGVVQASLVDCGNPCAFVLASDVGMSGTETPAEIKGDVLAKLNALRNAASVAMGLTGTMAEADKKRSVPKVVVLSPPSEHAVLSGAVLGREDTDVVCRCISAGDPHRALPITAALCTAAAAQVPGTLVAKVARRGDDGIVIGHASGTIAVDARVEQTPQGWEVPSASVFRTARKLFEGNVFVDEVEELDP
ncbi:hypothetical protein A1Q2_07894 [Trichosporon asahii var. asahii CBS 8904]|uniref:Uncharacterized protein n=1 Tax=Trichosporon asahii var. asahii (strain CBS 8904) TaxID=1220162 RepID=K1VFN1_TRIAC|nr:hypothetical protein A1Q2_07894 [Trichosporon asahii var. asahii CBS 8904]